MAILSRSRNRVELIEACDSVRMPENMLRFLIDYLFPMISCGSCQDDKINQLMEHVLQHHFFQFYPEFTRQLSCLSFIQCDDTITRKAPNELYDCSNALLRDIFLGEPVFPLAPFDKPQLLHCLRQCNLKTTVSGQDLFQVIENVASECSEIPMSVSSKNMTKIKAVLRCINHQPETLSERVLCIDGNKGWYTEFSKALRFSYKNWLPVEAIPPKSYRKHLLWKGECFTSHVVSHSSQSVILCCESEMEQLAWVAGSQMYFVSCPRVLCRDLQQTITIIPEVFDHFFHIIDQYELLSPSVVDRLVHHIYAYLMDNIPQVKAYCSLNDLSTRNVIWTKKLHKFSTPREIVLHERSSFPYNLAPFHDILSESLQDYSRLFQLFGVKSEYSDSDIISVLGKIQSSDEDRLSSQAAWKIVDHILNWLTDGGQSLASEKFSEDYETLLVPVQSDSKRPLLVDAENVVYTDLDFLRDFKSEGAETQFIHEKFAHLAMPLGLKALSTHLNVSYDAFDDVGQHEPLITRLKNILKDYKDGLTIIKELLPECR